MAFLVAAHLGADGLCDDHEGDPTPLQRRGAGDAVGWTAPFFSGEGEYPNERERGTVAETDQR